MLSPGYAFEQIHMHLDAPSQDTSSVFESEGSSPVHSAQLRSHINLRHGIGWDVSAYFVDRLKSGGNSVLHPAGYRTDMAMDRSAFDERGGAESREGSPPGVCGQQRKRSIHTDQAQCLREVHLAILSRSGKLDRLNKTLKTFRRAVLPSSSGALDRIGNGSRSGWSICCLAVVTQAQSATEYQVKAAFLFNFAKFVEWPADAFPGADARLANLRARAGSFRP